MNKITSINGIPCDLVKAEIVEDMLSALKKARTWMDNEPDEKLYEHDKAIYDETMEVINAALKKATQP